MKRWSNGVLKKQLGLYQINSITPILQYSNTPSINCIADILILA
jgi:hypothetical protein